MHHSANNSKHWSYGITYTQNPSKWIDGFINFDKDKWNEYKNNKTVVLSPNIDWFTTWLGEESKVNIKTFYIDNIYFVHDCNPLLAGPLGFVHYCNGNINYPIVQGTYGLNELSAAYVPVADDVIKFDFNIQDKTSLNFYLDKFVNIEKERERAKQLFPNGT